MSNYSRRQNYRLNQPNKGDKANKILNILIGVVLVLIIITGASIFISSDREKSDNESATNDAQQTNEEQTGKGDDSNSNPLPVSKEDDSETDESNSSDDQTKEEEPASSEDTSMTPPDETEAIKTPSDDPVVSETIVNPSWQPIGTKQSGNHVSSYEKGSIDWVEKEDALSYTTNLSKDNMIVWFLGNGGSPDKSIGVVSSNDKTQKYRVYLQWVDGQGWKPEKMEVLNTLEGVR